jgi:hypothetical protein
MLTAIAASFTLSTAFAAIPKNCTDEIVNISKGNGFNMQKFTSDLPVAVAKAKLQAKVPFGKPKDGDKTDIGMTFGCLKVFPESPGEILSLLKDVSQEMAKGAAASQLGAGQESQYQPQQAQPEYQQQAQQPQYQYPPPQQIPPEYQQQAQPQYQYPPLLVQCKLEKVICECECSKPSAKNYESLPNNFTGGQRFATWFLNTITPIGLGSAIIMNDYAGMGVQMGFNTAGALLIAGANEPEFGIFFLGVNFIFNIFRSANYDKPGSVTYHKNNGLNFAVLPNKRGEAMPYVMYNKAF